MKTITPKITSQNTFEKSVDTLSLYKTKKTLLERENGKKHVFTTFS